MLAALKVLKKTLEEKLAYSREDRFGFTDPPDYTYGYEAGLQSAIDEIDTVISRLDGSTK